MTYNITLFMRLNFVCIPYLYYWVNLCKSSISSLIIKYTFQHYMSATMV